MKLSVPLFFMHKWILYSIASINGLYCEAFVLLAFCVIYRKGHFETFCFFILYVQMNFVFNCFHSCIASYCGACLAEICVIYRKGHFETFCLLFYVQMNFVFNYYNSCIASYCGARLVESELKQVVGSDSLPHPCPP